MNVGFPHFELAFRKIPGSFSTLGNQDPTFSAGHLEAPGNPTGSYHPSAVTSGCLGLLLEVSSITLFVLGCRLEGLRLCGSNGVAPNGVRDLEKRITCTSSIKSWCRVADIDWHPQYVNLVSLKCLLLTRST